MTTIAAIAIWPDAVGLGLLVIASFAHVIAWSRWLLPGINGYRQPSVSIDVWMPLVLVIPMLGAVRWMTFEVGPATEAITTTPIVLAAIGLGLALLTGRWTLKGQLLVTRRYIAVMWPLAGVFLLMIAAAHQLSIWIGQSIFAMAAVIMWINTPDLRHESTDRRGQTSDGDSTAAGVGLALSVFIAAGQGVILSLIGPDLQGLATAVVILQSLALLILGLRALPGLAVSRVALWTGCYGVLFGIGMMSLSRMLPRATLLAFNRDEAMLEAPVLEVAVGFGTLAWEGTLLCLIGGVPFLAGQVTKRPARIIGFALLACGVVLGGYRIAEQFSG